MKGRLSCVRDNISGEIDRETIGMRQKDVRGIKSRPLMDTEYEVTGEQGELGRRRETAIRG
jgi:hypothetical protein